MKVLKGVFLFFLFFFLFFSFFFWFSFLERVLIRGFKGRYDRDRMKGGHTMYIITFFSTWMRMSRHDEINDFQSKLLHHHHHHHHHRQSTF